MSHTIIDRRLNPGGKSLGNRERFVKKAKESIKKVIRDTVADRTITNTGQQKVKIPIDGISEPYFRNNPDTVRDRYVLPGNKEFVVGDVIKKPEKGGGNGNTASNSGESEDEFNFVLSKEEYARILFDGLELPDFIKKSSKQVITTVRARAGYSSSGNPSLLDLERSMVNSLGRRIALKFPKLKKIRELEQALLNESLDDEERDIIIKEISRLKRKANAITFLDPIDLKYKKFEVRPQPMTQAVMFCVMDVSASVNEYQKDLAKRFYMLLHMFLSSKYKNIEIVFIRHTTEAKECDEEEFFYSKESGGTVVSSAFELMTTIIKERYPTSEWNIYCAQASDGDNYENDNSKVIKLVEALMPIMQYFIYVELDSEHTNFSVLSKTNLWELYENSLKSKFENIVMKKLISPEVIYSVFRDIFAKEKK